MVDTQSKQKKNRQKKNPDYYDLKLLSQSYGSDGMVIRNVGEDMDNYIDSPPDFEAWITPTVDLEYQLKRKNDIKEEKLLE
ncbi:hypothetical protein [Oceanirhabdus sp. W0125-5]|uniref:hypothetical protein n=1 Tax=Oceanirhabdus sp. W0125-5 TaxID=2999116 RepID=UPI0022F2E92A|nr:hypothetical protein [Oceanirhabdus sp. W0125-5]WBW97958.1 hypothetical protein OW730_04130 [Oceanirhabdus sp. W0125-5]